MDKNCNCIEEKVLFKNEQKMKIGIITILKCNNFGAELQAFATQKKLELLGYDAEIIDYLYFKHPKFKFTKRCRPFVHFSLKTKILEFVKYRIISPILYNVIPYFSATLRKRNNKFDSFHLNNTKMSTTFSSIDELYSEKFNYDGYLVGSDQVWNPGTGVTIEPYFLTFAQNNKPKIAYASSFGVTSIPSQYLPNYQKLLGNLDRISVREDAGAKIVKDITGRKAEVVLDPTLLLNKEEWNRFGSGTNPSPQGYVLIYEVHPSVQIQNLAFKYAKEHNLPIYRIGVRGLLNWGNKGITNLCSIGPDDFISLFNNATIIFTNSFHGTAFSVNFAKQFYTVLSKQGKKNSRMTSLLNILNLSSRIIYDSDEINNIKWKKVNTKESQELLNVERDKSVAFLTKSLKNNV